MPHTQQHKAKSALKGTNTVPNISIMGIININRESFYSKSRCLSPTESEAAFIRMAQDGADYIDIGACSTKPGSVPVPEEKEWEYLKKPLQRIAEALSKMKEEGQTHIPAISIDTFRSGIVRKVFDIIGPFTVNDISSGEDDSQMLATVSELGLDYIAMHKRGTPENMQSLTDYPEGVVKGVRAYFEAFAEKAEKSNIRNWILDPGFGFAKTVEQNYHLLEGLDQLKTFGKPILVGLSRKSMIYKPLGITPEESLPATCALNLRALEKGATILRVHDVREAVQVAKLYELSKSPAL